MGSLLVAALLKAEDKQTWRGKRLNPMKDSHGKRLAPRAGSIHTQRIPI